MKGNKLSRVREKDKRSTSRKQQKPAALPSKLKDDNGSKRQEMAQMIQVGSAVIENLSIKIQDEASRAHEEKALGQSHFQIRQTLVDKLTEPVLKSAAMKFEHNKASVSPLRRLPTLPLPQQLIAEEEKEDNRPTLRSTRSAIQTSEAQEKVNKSDMLRERNKDMLRLIAKSKGLTQANRRLIQVVQRTQNAKQDENELQQAQNQGKSQVLFTSKAQNKQSSTSLFSPDKIYKSISTIQDKYPNLKVDTRQIAEDQFRPTQQSLTSKKEQINFNRLEAIVSPSRQLNQDENMFSTDALIVQQFEQAKQKFSKAATGASIIRTKQLEFHAEAKEQPRNIGVRKLKSMRKSKNIGSTTVDSIQKRRPKQLNQYQPQSRPPKQKKQELVERIIASEQLINNIIRERNSRRPSREIAVAETLETSHDDNLNLQGFASPTYQQCLPKSSEQSMSNSLILNDMVQQKRSESKQNIKADQGLTGSPVHGSGLQAIHKLKKRLQYDDSVKEPSLKHENSLPLIQNDTPKIEREIRFATPVRNDSHRTLNNLSKRGSDVSTDRRALSSFRLTEQGSKLRQSSVDAAAEREREKIHQIINSKSSIKVSKMQHCNSLRSGERAIENLCDSDSDIQGQNVLQQSKLNQRKSSLESFWTPDHKAKLSTKERLINHTKQAQTVVKANLKEQLSSAKKQGSKVVAQTKMSVRMSLSKLHNENMRIVSRQSDKSQEKSHGYRSSLNSSLTAQFKNAVECTPQLGGIQNDKKKREMQSTIEIAQSYQLSEATITGEMKNEHEWDPKNAIFKPIEKGKLRRKQLSIQNQRYQLVPGEPSQEQEIYGGTTMSKHQANFKAINNLVSLPEIPMHGASDGSKGDCVYGSNPQSQSNQSGHFFRFYTRLAEGRKQSSIEQERETPSKSLQKFMYKMADNKGRQSQPIIDTNKNEQRQPQKNESSQMKLVNEDSACDIQEQKDQQSAQLIQAPQRKNSNKVSQLDKQRQQQEYSSLISHRNRQSEAQVPRKVSKLIHSTSTVQNGRKFIHFTNEKSGNSNGTTGNLQPDKLFRGTTMQRNRSHSNQGSFLRSASNFKNLASSKEAEIPRQRKKSESKIKAQQDQKADPNDENEKSIAKISRTNKFIANEVMNNKTESKPHIQPQSQLVSPSRSQRVIQPVTSVKMGAFRPGLAGAPMANSHMNTSTYVAAINSFKPSQRPMVKQSYRIFRKDQQQIESIEPEQKRQCIALCLEGLCAVLRKSQFCDENSQNAGPCFIRDNLLEALNSFIKATGGSITLIMYTYLSESYFDEKFVNLDGLKELWSGSEFPIERVIFLQSFRHGFFEKSELSIDDSFLPQGTQELLWVHPFGLEFGEILSQLKNKKYEDLLYDGETVRYVQGLPFLAPRDSKSSKITEFSFLISSLDFDLDARKSVSMLAIMKTIQSLYFLGKITHLVSKKKTMLVPAVIQQGLVPAPVTKPIKPTVTFSFQKSFKTVKEHMLLSLVAFQASATRFHADNPPEEPEQDNLAIEQKIQKPSTGINWFPQSNQQNKLQNRQSSQQAKRQLPENAKHYAQPDLSKLRQLESTNQMMDLAPGINMHQSFFSEKQQFLQKELESGGQPRQFISYLQPTMSSQAAVTNHQNEINSHNSGFADRQSMSASGGIFSPRNVQKQKLIRDLTRQNREIAKHVKQYAKQGKTTAQKADEASLHEDNDQDQTRNIMILDGWLIEKFPLVELSIPE